MKTRKCSTCKQDKPTKAFSKYKRSPDGLNYQCNECKSAYFQRTKVERNKHARERTQRLRDRVSLMNTTVGCKCGERRPWVLDFHHTSGHDKEYNISRLVVSSTWAKVEKELTKCIVICANCHRDLHYQENNLPSSSG